MVEDTRICLGPDFNIDIEHACTRLSPISHPLNHISNPWIISLSWGIKSQKTPATPSVSGCHKIIKEKNTQYLCPKKKKKQSTHIYNAKDIVMR